MTPPLPTNATVLVPMEPQPDCGTNVGLEVYPLPVPLTAIVTEARLLPWMVYVPVAPLPPPPVAVQVHGDAAEHPQLRLSLPVFTAASLKIPLTPHRPWLVSCQKWPLASVAQRSFQLPSPGKAAKSFEAPTDGLAWA